MLKRVFRLTLRAAQGFIDSIFTLMKLLLRCPDYSCVSRRAKSVNIPFKTPTRGEIAHLVIDYTGLKVFGEGEWKVKNTVRKSAASGGNFTWRWTPVPMRLSALTCP
ncbi:Uncharacterised protein [Serratia proteamaculans]|nr:Uncharacterised protein [Serratia proteamaculans]